MQKMQSKLKYTQTIFEITTQSEKQGTQNYMPEKHTSTITIIILTYRKLQGDQESEQETHRLNCSNWKNSFKKQKICANISEPTLQK